ncbi:MAG: hypothetical protein COX17_04390 [Deltaproteobacteria bacterium CG23_combo_of_CG06-09_8_20_14_all_60_8]|nr:MAG: hypothetical protein COX17_04390 [Deltaproteobacteria bacterium CG23_combo_of_CG06-09_8_20_14_all_60_8]
MREAAVDQVIAIDHLPTLPAVAIEAIRLMEGEPANFDSIADLLKNDQVLTGRILHYANSAFVGFQRKVVSISQAIALLGFSTVRSIVLSISIFDFFAERFARQRAGVVNFWLHSIGVAVAAEILAKKLGFAEPDEAYVAGLLHDMGKFVAFLQQPEKFERVCQELELQAGVGSEQSLPLDLERGILGTTHVELGKRVAEQWGFPESLARVLWLHHQPTVEAILPGNEHLPALIRFADLLCVTHNVGTSYFLAATPHSQDHFHFALENMVLLNRFSAADIEAVMDEVHGRVQEVASVLGIWDEETYRKLVGAANITLGSMSMKAEASMVELVETNRALAATCDMVRQLHAGLPLAEAARIVITAARRAFNVNRCLCMFRHEAVQAFVGQLAEDDGFHEIQVPLHMAEMRRYARQAEVSDIESEAMQCLERTAGGLGKGADLEAGVRTMVSGSKFLAAFFMADTSGRRGRDPILGELILDFQDAVDLRSEGMAVLSRNFESLVLAAGNAIERLLLFEDLTGQAAEMAENSRKMEENQRQLFHAHRLATVGRLAAGAAHEINNPLTIISLNTQILSRTLRKMENVDDLNSRLKVITDQEERISKIIQELMGFARPAEPKFCQVGLAEIVGKVVKVIGDRVPMARIRLDNRIAVDLPLVMVDPLQMEQVFMNLLINANHAMPDGGTITLEAAPRNGFLEVRVADTGQGIDPRNLPKIFDPFFTTKKEGEGTGLGLAVCHSIVEHNGGAMRVTSELGKGTTFYVVLPVDKGSRLRAMKEDLKQQDVVEVPERRSKERYRILVIDDERILNDMLQDGLRGAGFEVDGAYDGVEGIGQLRFKQYHVVLLDIRMPRKDGLEVLRFIKEEFPDIQVIIVTGLASKQEIKDTVKKGAFACLKKPFMFEKVLETINNALAARHGDQ